MRTPRRALAALVAATFLVALPGSAGETRLNLAKGRYVPYGARAHQMDNGLRVVVFPIPGTGMFSLYELVGTGSRDEVEPGHSGFAHFFEHMMFRGTARFPAEKRNQLLSSLGVDDGGYTTDDFTMYHFTGPAEALGPILELEADRYQHLEYSEDAFRTEAKAVLGEYNKNLSDPDRKAWEVLRDLAYDKHTYQHTTLGFLADIERMPEELAYSRSFFKKFYTPDNVILFIAGDVDEMEAIKLARQHWASWAGKRARPTIPVEPPQTSERRKAVAWESPVLPRLHVAWPVPSSAAEPKSAALATVLETYLFSESSALYRELVLEDGSVDALSCWWAPHADPSLFPVVLRLKNETSPDAVLARIQAALDDIAAGKIDVKRFEHVKSHLRYAVLMQMTSPESVLQTLAYYAGHAMDPTALDTMLVETADLEPPDLTAFVRAHFGQTQRNVVTLSSKATGGAP